MVGISSSKKLPSIWRWAAAALSLAIGTYEIVGYKVARSINLNYFKDKAVPISVLDIAVLLAALYLLTIAISGYWRPYRKDS